ncbi:hypothetical protein CANINC_002221 [Pichia inconspicua]|uniref:t-SNARE coiled-coil homology domain-containing protein n=1 Tax=Pichia inconspicua TaxID=52247 RepID=A0A4T0X1Q2_9ASCO|nr:hypothetical protein CANINC_002221 [[Candida] inconspicua]
METDNDQRFNALAGKVSAFRAIASDVNNYAARDNNQLDSLQNRFDALSEGLRSTSSKLTHVIKSNPKISKLVAVGFLIFLIIYYSIRLL